MCDTDLRVQDPEVGSVNTICCLLLFVKVAAATEVCWPTAWQTVGQNEGTLSAPVQLAPPPHNLICTHPLTHPHMQQDIVSEVIVERGITLGHSKWRHTRYIWTQTETIHKFVMCTLICTIIHHSVLKPILASHTWTVIMPPREQGSLCYYQESALLVSYFCLCRVICGMPSVVLMKGTRSNTIWQVERRPLVTQYMNRAWAERERGTHHVANHIPRYIGLYHCSKVMVNTKPRRMCVMLIFNRSQVGQTGLEHTCYPQTKVSYSINLPPPHKNDLNFKILILVWDLLLWYCDILNVF